MAEIESGARFDYVIVGAGSAGLRAGEPADAKTRTSPSRCWKRAARTNSLLVRMPAGVGNLIATKGATNWGFETTPQKHSWTAGALSAARTRLGRIVGHQRHDLHSRPRARLRSMAPDGPHRLGLRRRAARTSNARSITKTAPMRGTPKAGRSGCRAGRRAIRSTRRSSKPARRRAIRSRAISTAVSKKASAPIISPSATANAGARRLRYLRPIVGVRPNLKVISNAHADRVIIENKTAVGVEFSAGPGKPVQNVYAKREVLVCGGAFQSPHLLLLSGIGPGGRAAEAGRAGRARCAGSRAAICRTTSTSASSTR